MVGFRWDGRGEMGGVRRVGWSGVGQVGWDGWG